ncbi:hypothetical protein DFH07DRAFT_955706 [Mycena maculata]|uniref:Uncharacterized protein n=1 Tax=Mycena maculata TaxID=230809 RepID=A0AAD7JKX6_9AGAR|nr:hypothetical protein DFH07DRAFT_955706 [Mycena maculata]
MLSGSVPPVVPGAPAPFVHDWNAPHAKSLPVPPPSFDGRPRKNPLPLHALKFNPLGIFELRCHLGLPTSWDTYRRRFISGDIAWFASGASEDNQHWPNSEGFFREFDNLRESVPRDVAGYNARKDFAEQVRKLIFDLLTMWDRTWGSTSMLLHVEGTTMPNTPPAPEFLRACVYLPPAFIGRNPGSHRAIAQIAQMFIESVGVPTVLNWKANAQLRNWPLTQTGPAPSPNNIRAGTLIPAPKQYGAAHYIFHGRPAGFTFPVPGAGRGGTGGGGGAGGGSGGPGNPGNGNAGSGGAPGPPSQASSHYGSEEPEFTPDALALITALERITELEHEAAQMVAQVNDCMAEADDLYSRVQVAAEEQKCLLAIIASLEDQLAASAVSTLQPPAYHPASPICAPRALPMPSTPSRIHVPSTPGRSVADHPLHLTTGYLDTAAATSLLPSIRMMSRWSKELRKLNMVETVREGVLESLTQDLDL